MAESLHTLVVDDEAGIRFFLAETLEQAGHVVTSAISGPQALELLQDTAFDLVLLDLKLGGRVDGLRVLEAIRWRWPTTVVIILTAHGSLDSALTAIQEGVDGYLLKPVRPEQVRQAVREAFERRRKLVQEEGEEEERTLQRGPLAVDLEQHVATRDGQPLDLTPREFRLLAHLMQNEHRVVPPPELARVVREYGPDSTHEARQIIRWYVHHLRQKIEPDPAEPHHILNVRGVGYRFKG
ncbi:MAG: response regulator transcription factor [Chloroflexi bacterium]|nr:response regulator transcription factor [Chloroflexota bacterium]MBU1750670.1 response regulator transcription factor [Chloroflexota bacterium]